MSTVNSSTTARLRCLLSGVLVATLGACSRSSGQQVIAAHQDWVLVSGAEEDPFDDAEEPETSCPLSSYGSEGTVFEIESGTCEYATFKQPIDAEVREGDSLKYLIWHLNLWDESPGQAHIALQVGDWLMWERFIDIPADAEVYDGELEAPHDILLGDAYLHLHNHGVNSWRVADITAGKP